MREKAFRVYSQFRSGKVSPTSSLRLNHGADDVGSCDELAIFGGQTRVLVSKLLTSNAPNWDDAKFLTNLSPITKSEEVAQDISEPFRDKMEDVHPSLVEYMALFPPSAFSPDLNVYPDFPSPQPTLDNTSIMSDVSALPQSNAAVELSNYSYPQCPPPQPQLQAQAYQQAPQYLPRTFVDSVAPSSSYDSSSSSFFGVVQDSQTYSRSVSTPTSASDPDTPASGDLVDLGLMMNGDSGMDEQWMSFMRDSGILNRTAGVGT